MQMSRLNLPNLFFIDEIFGPVFNKNLKHAYRLLESLVDNFDQILVISHKEELKEMFENKITIKKINNVSEIY
jgi:DNA repair exonuclease SbcCD ATPase subunit